MYILAIENKINKIKKEKWFYYKDTEINVLKNSFVNSNNDTNNFFCNKGNKCIWLLWTSKINESSSIYDFLNNVKIELDSNEDYFNYLKGAVNKYKENPSFKTKYKTLDNYLLWVTEYELWKINNDYYKEDFYLLSDNNNKQFDLNECIKVDFSKTWILQLNKPFSEKYWIYKTNNSSIIERIENYIKKESFIDYIVYDLSKKTDIIYNCYEKDIYNKTKNWFWNSLFFIKTNKKLYILNSYWIMGLSDDKLLNKIGLK
jgi:hypothetical protein